MATTSGVLPPPIQQKFSAKLLSTPQSRLIHGMFAMPYTMDERSGDIMRMRRYTRLATAPVPLGAAMNNPPVQTLNAVDLDSQIDWYARHNWRNKTFSDGLGTPNVLDEDNKAQAIYRCAA